MQKDFIFTSECVTEGHPDKLCDQISDAIVDHLMLQDPCARIRAECAVTSAIVFIAAHFATSAKADLPHVARKVIKHIGYDQQDFNSKTCSILTAPQGFPPDKDFVFNEHELTDEQVAKIHVKNQVNAFGFACDHTSVLMPLPIWLSRQLTNRLSEVRMSKLLPYLMPDGKVQIGVEFCKGKPCRIHSITINASRMRQDRPEEKVFKEDIREAVIDPVFENEEIKPDNKTRIFINPDGPYQGGPSKHSGLTGRKNDVDTYGEYSRHSGNALSGKDPSRIDRVGAYAARHAAKNIVAAGLASDCEVTLSYSIGLTEPVSLQVQTFGTAGKTDKELTDMVKKYFDFRLVGILRRFDLRNMPSRHPEGYFQSLAGFGHFGRTDMDLPWEKVDMVEVLKAE